MKTLIDLNDKRYSNPFIKGYFMGAEDKKKDVLKLLPKCVCPICEERLKARLKG